MGNPNQKELIIGGMLMLVLPGQGLFTILIGLMLSNYPGKFYIEKKFIAIPNILKTINPYLSIHTNLSNLLYEDVLLHQ